ncbi:hypothetical protein TNCT_209221 [Trichonephila clavata]|uniref:Uncharacterized protein n=1 Tax=Trichonephila clavata TaxID=2740835 RepID=A0A8X6F128_TRICU|nr:hypothetical protein TNCT_209221 [Trichonephila clavata]
MSIESIYLPTAREYKAHLCRVVKRQAALPFPFAQTSPFQTLSPGKVKHLLLLLYMPTVVLDSTPVNMVITRIQ